MTNTPPYERLRLHRETCLLGLAAAEQCSAMERAGHYRACLEDIDRRIAALITPAYPEHSRAAFRRLVLARRDGLITAREFGMAAWWARQRREG